MGKFRKYFDEMSDDEIEFLYESIRIWNLGFENKSFEEMYDKIIFENDFSSNKFREKIKKLSDIPYIGKMAEGTNVFLSMLKDSYKKKYAITNKTKCTLIFASLYYVLPIDFIPDKIPIIGKLDDVIVFQMTYESVKDDLYRYKGWKHNEEMEEFTEDLVSVYNERSTNTHSEDYEEEEVIE